LLNANLRIRIGKDAKEYVRIVGRGEKYKRGSISFSSKGKEIAVNVKANDAAALLASLNSALKQLRVVNDINSIFGSKTK
jgi:tRNA threonylcarbamoyladenosine modification (KEOPS) complex  Pcc1 subunit